MSSPTIAQKAPFAVDVEAGKSYWWCQCGNSKNQPFCDGSHKGGPFAPTEYKATETGKVWFCGCKHTKNGALCDGTHKTLCRSATDAGAATRRCSGPACG